MLFLALVVGLAFGAGEAGRTTVGIFVEFENTPSPASVGAMQKELQALLAPGGFTPVWRQLRLNKGDEEFDRVVIVRFKGQCSAGLGMDSPLPDHLGGEMRLAHTEVAGGRVLPRAEVECDNIKQGVARTPLKDRATVFGHVLGRVLAHELYHLLLQTVEHQKAGLAQAILNWSELLSTRPRFGSSFLNGFRRGAHLR